MILVKAQAKFLFLFLDLTGTGTWTAAYQDKEDFDDALGLT